MAVPTKGSGNDSIPGVKKSPRPGDEPMDRIKSVGSLAFPNPGGNVSMPSVPKATVRRGDKSNDSMPIPKHRRLPVNEAGA